MVDGDPGVSGKSLERPTMGVRGRSALFLLTRSLGVGSGRTSGDGATDRGPVEDSGSRHGHGSLDSRRLPNDPHEGV